jgi:hypothetical protein
MDTTITTNVHVDSATPMEVRRSTVSDDHLVIVLGEVTGTSVTVFISEADLHRLCRQAKAVIEPEQVPALAAVPAQR